MRCHCYFRAPWGLGFQMTGAKMKVAYQLCFSLEIEKARVRETRLTYPSCYFSGKKEKHIKPFLTLKRRRDFFFVNANL